MVGYRSHQPALSQGSPRHQHLQTIRITAPHQSVTLLRATDSDGQPTLREGGFSMLGTKAGAATPQMALYGVSRSGFESVGDACQSVRLTQRCLN